jgi:hypothetical protein
MTRDGGRVLKPDGKGEADLEAGLGPLLRAAPDAP